MSFKRMLSVLLILILVLADVAMAENYFAKTTGSVTVYASASTSSKKLGTLKSGSWVFLSAEKNGWAKIELNGKVGYANASNIQKTTRAVYVKSGSATIYKTAGYGSTRMSVVGYGTKLTAKYVKNGFIYVSSGSGKGFIPSSDVQTKDPNTLNKTVYAQASSAKVYSLPSAGSDSFTVSGTTQMTCTAVYNNTWARVTVNGKTGYIKKSLLGSGKYSVPNTTVYITAGSSVIYKDAGSSSDKLATLAYGSSLKAAAETSNGYTKVASGSKTGWIRSGDISTKNPNNLNKTVYIKAAGVKIYAYPTTSASSGTVSTSAALKCTSVYNDTWCRVTYSGKVGFVKKSEVSTKKLGSSTSSPASGKSVKVDWFKGNIQSVFDRNDIATVTDVYTGISWRVKRKGGYNHADVEPLTAADTAAMQRACGSDFLTWARRPIWVSIGGKKYAASMNCMNHGECNIKDNNFNGHFCIHFTNSRTHGSNKVDSDHQSAINTAYSRG
ncbi:MAG: SH3 domain-containing protein [Clostridia bacterium]|nr:SH3 domain-containing protein [Clostridia bacterium]